MSRAGVVGRVLGIVAMGLSLAACLAMPSERLAAAEPSNPKERVPAARYRPVLGGYMSQRPVEPAPWRERNESVAPKPRSER
jgi:hypothetical protein